MVISYWKIWVVTKTEEKAVRVFESAMARMNCQAQHIAIEPYPKLNGFVI